MQLSPELLRSFADAITPEKSKNGASTVYATVRTKQADGTVMIRLDGADVDIPASCSVSVSALDRVLVMLKGRQAIVTGNLTEGSGDPEGEFRRITNTEIEELLSLGEGE